MTLSIIIVNFNVREFLEQALLSLGQALKDISHEIWVVDNASTDGSCAFIRKKFPEVRLIENIENLGFARANNQAIARAVGDYICLINPDTLVQEDTFAVLLKYLADHPHVGMVGAKVLNADGTLQAACRRSYPTPWVAFTKIVGLSSLFPRSRWFGRYNLTYLDPDQAAEVEAISGSFMLLRRSVVDQVGGLDESFFMYGEDWDWCYRIRRAGHQIMYVPDTQIIHFKGESSKKSPFQQRRLFYEAMRLFVRKHFKKGSAWLPSWLLVIAIYVSAAVSFASTLLRKLIWPLTDLLAMTAAIAAAVYLRFHPQFPWAPFLPVHLVYSLIWLISLSAHGLYTKSHLSGAKAASGVLVGLMMNSSLTFFFNQYGFSRAVVLAAGAFNLLLLPFWRLALKWIARRHIPALSRMLNRYLLQRRSLVVGDAAACEKIIHRLRSAMTGLYAVEGAVLLNDGLAREDVAGVPVVGFIDDLPEIIRRERVQEVIFTTENLPYDKLLGAVANSFGSQISFKMVPSNLDVVIGKATLDYIDDIPFVDLEYRLHQGLYRAIKRLFDVGLALVLLIVGAPIYGCVRWIRRTPIVNRRVHFSARRAGAVPVFQGRTFWRFLPSLPAVLRGDISFVGRRLEAESPMDVVYLSLKPGLTGLEQINSHRILTFDDRRRYGLYYLKKYSPILDLEIILRTMFKRKQEK